MKVLAWKTKEANPVLSEPKPVSLLFSLYQLTPSGKVLIYQTPHRSAFKRALREIAPSNAVEIQVEDLAEAIRLEEWWDTL